MELVATIRDPFISISALFFCGVAMKLLLLWFFFNSCSYR
jgi:hypothetical protein